MTVERDVPIGPMTTYRVGGAASFFARVDSDGDICDLVSFVGENGHDVLVVGKGSNLLVADGGFDGVAVVLGEHFEAVTIEGSTVTAGAAAALPVVARRSAAASLTGFEWAVGVPGSIGGAVRMNAGGHGSDMAATLTRVRVVDLANGDDGWMAASIRRPALSPSGLVKTEPAF
jgi:UDP-N-acetylmuramate dehydrogenase